MDGATIRIENDKVQTPSNLNVVLHLNIPLYIALKLNLFLFQKVISFP